MTFGEKLRSKRLELGLTQKEVANNMGISAQAYAQYEKADRQPKAATIHRIATALKIVPGLLITEWESVDLDNWPEISEADIKILREYRKLNETGKSEAVRQVNILAKVPEYRKEN